MKTLKPKTERAFVALEHWSTARGGKTVQLVTRRRNGQFLDHMSARQMRTVGIKEVK